MKSINCDSLGGNGSKCASRAAMASERVTKLKADGLWPVRHTATFYRKAARRAPDTLVRAILLLAADRMPKATGT